MPITIRNPLSQKSKAGLYSGRFKTVSTVLLRTKTIKHFTQTRSNLLQVVLLSTLTASAFYRAYVTHPLGVDGYLLYVPGIALAPLVLCQVLLAALHRSKLSLSCALLGLTILVGPVMGLRWNSPMTYGEDTLTLVSLNINSWHTDLENAAHRIREEHPDLIALQEVWATKHLKNFRDTFPDYEFTEPAGAVGFGGANFIGVRTRAGLATASQHATYEAAGFIVERGGRQFLVLTLHSPRSRNLGPAGLRETIREQTEQTQAVLHLAEEVKVPCIIVGDFNCPPSGPSQKLLKARLQSAFDKVGKGFGYTFPSRLPFMRIDHAWGSSEIQFHEIKKVDFGSDHLGIVLKFSLPGPGVAPPGKRSPEKTGQRKNDNP